MAVCLVTGGAGLIGSHLAEGLVAQGHTVRILDNLSTGKRANLESILPRIELSIGDITDFETVRAAVTGVELVFHQAALDSVARGLADPLATHHVCATGTLLLLLAARDAGVRRFIYAASASAYGNAQDLPERETHPTFPRSPDAVAKLTGEQYCELFNYLYGLETVRLRYFNVFGPRQSADSPQAAVIPRFVETLIQGRRPVIYGDGRQSRDFTYVADVVQANLLAAQAQRVSGKVYNIAYGSRTNLLELVGWLNELLGTDIEPIHESPRPGDIRHSHADTSLAQAELGYCPCTDVKEGLRHYLDYYLTEHPLLERATPARWRANGCSHAAS